jgi:branched-chain amino acid transport system ATP-binding protein
MTAPLLRTEKLVKQFGGLVATDGVDLTVAHGEIHALIGPNGAGKSTLIAQIAGELKSDAGDVYLDETRITRMAPAKRAARGLGRTFQTTSVFPALTVRENAVLAVLAQDGHGFRFWRPALRDEVLAEAAEALLDQTGLTARAEALAENLSHGERRRLEMAMVLAASPRLLLLDEPTAGMGGEESQAMIALLAGLKHSLGMLLVEHDMDVVFALADRITVLDYGRVICCGDPGDVRADPAVRRAYLGEGHA